MTVLIRQGNAEWVVGIQGWYACTPIANRVGLCLNSKLDELISNHCILENRRTVALEILHGIHQVLQPDRLHRVSACLTRYHTPLVLKRFHGHSPATALVSQQTGLWNARISEKGFIEAVLTCHFSDRSRLDTCDFHWRKEK